ncbi:DNA-binding protein [Stenotrophomonas sp. YIM B06876]|uniref:DNA-binding protein n=1 Tax=Stenotrophomonas sp. YIM B06876 TaxID=3060211 RepID=UPI002739803B|nr:DNA-binding protein [Stenotrophomonas sp. YIM B06876]
MTLQNLLAIKRLLAHAPDAAAVRKLLAAAQRNMTDAGVAGISTDNRFDAAYKCVMQCAMLGLWASGYRTATSQPGHHQTAIQCLTLTMSVPTPTVIVLDALRKQRNLSDYEGDPISEATLASCVDEASKLLAHTRQWLRDHHSDLLGDA